MNGTNSYENLVLHKVVLGGQKNPEAHGDHRKDFKMEYKGYSARVTFDDDAMIFHGEVDGIADVVTFQADTAEGLVQSFRDSVDDYLDFCAEKGNHVAVPFGQES